MVAFYPREGLVSPPIEHVLPGISLQVLKELAGRLGIAFVARELTADEFAAASGAADQHAQLPAAGNATERSADRHGKPG